MAIKYPFHDFENWMAAQASYVEAERAVVALCQRLIAEGFGWPVNEPTFEGTVDAHPRLQQLESARIKARDRALHYYHGVVVYLHPQLLTYHDDGETQIQNQAKTDSTPRP